MKTAKEILKECTGHAHGLMDHMTLKAMQDYADQETNELKQAYELLLKSLPAIYFKGEPITDSEDKSIVIKTAIEGSAILLKKTFDMCGLVTHINGTLIFDATGETFELKFTKINHHAT